MKTLANTGDVSLRSAKESARGAKTVQSRANDTNCYLLGGGNDLPTASLGKSIAKTLGIPTPDHEHRVKWEIPAQIDVLFLPGLVYLGAGVTHEQTG